MLLAPQGQVAPWKLPGLATPLWNRFLYRICFQASQHQFIEARIERCLLLLRQGACFLGVVNLLQRPPQFTGPGVLVVLIQLAQFAEQMELAREIMRRNRDVLRELAK